MTCKIRNSFGGFLNNGLRFQLYTVCLYNAHCYWINKRLRFSTQTCYFVYILSSKFESTSWMQQTVDFHTFLSPLISGEAILIMGLASNSYNILSSSTGTYCSRSLHNLIDSWIFRAAGKTPACTSQTIWFIYARLLSNYACGLVLLHLLSYFQQCLALLWSQAL